MLKKIIYIIMSLYASLNIENLFASSIQDNIKPGETTDGVVNDLLSGSSENPGLDGISVWIVNSIDFLLPITAVGVLLFVGIRLALAQGNPEEFKKSWKQFIYAIVGIFIISFAWVAVKLVSGLNI